MLRLLQHPVVLLLLCFSLVGAPVTYRGGASNPHPHMFLEFLMDAGAGSFDHHHGGDEPSEEHGEHGSHEHHHESDQPSESPKATDAPERFGASLSAFVVGDVGQLTLILPDHALPQSERAETAFIRDNHQLSGITQSPTAPPPR